MAPFGLETKVEGVIVVPGQTVGDTKAARVTTGFTYARTCKGDPAQEEANGVMVYVTIPTELELLVNA